MLRHIALAAALAGFVGPAAIAAAASPTTSSTPAVTVSPAPTQANAQHVDQSFCGLMVEAFVLGAYFGTPDKPNTFSENLIKALANKTNTRPIVRVGGNSVDQGIYNTSQKEAVIVPPNTPPLLPAGIHIGPSFFDWFKAMPLCRYIFCVPLANEPEALSSQFAHDGYAAVGKENIESIEIGNEPNYYVSPGHFRPSGWNAADYDSQWAAWAANVSATLGLAPNDKIYNLFTVATHALNPPQAGWTLQDAFNAGLANSTGQAKSVALHYYQPVNTTCHNHSTIVEGLSYIVSDAQYLKQEGHDLPVILSEFAVDPDVGNTASEYVLSTIDIVLYAMSVGIERINYNNGPYPFALWQVDDPATKNTAAVFDAFYPYIAASEFLGPSGQTRVSELTLPPSVPDLVAYAAYEGTDATLARLALINYGATNQTLTLSLPSGTTGSVGVKRLTTAPPPGGGANFTWGGIEWSPENDGVGQLARNDSDYKVGVNGGAAVVTVVEGEAVVVSL